MFTLAHVSDIHLAPLPAPGIAALCSKRVLGYLSWRLNRHRVHSEALAELICRDVRAMAPDHVAVTGDLVNISLTAEFQAARTWLEGFGAPDWISVVPGNHDAYVPVAWNRGIGQWADYMAGDEQDSEPFPFVRRRGEMAIIGVSTAVATAPFLAAGSLGGAQIAALDARLAALSAEDPKPCRIVLIHHPPFPGQNSARKGLRDAGELAEVLRRHAPDLVLHGHNHRPMTAWLEGGAQPVPALGVASATAVETRGHKPLASYNLYRLTRGEHGWAIKVDVRAYDPGRKAFVDGGSVMLQSPGASVSAGAAA